MSVKLPTLPTICTDEWFKNIICYKHSIRPSDVHLTVTKSEALSGGYLSYITKLHVTWKPNQPQLPNSVVVKVVTISKLVMELEKTNGKDQASKTMELFATNLQSIHNNECYVYDSFFNSSDCNIPIPMVYATQMLGSGTSHGFIVLQDLSEVARCRPLHTAVTVHQAKKIVEYISEMQAYGLRSDEWKTQLNPVVRDAWADFADSIIKMFHEVKTKYPEIYTGVGITDVESFTNGDAYMKYYFEGPFQHSVFVHGDLWTNNILIAKEKGEISEDTKAIIDWQFCHAGQPGSDTAMFLGIHLNAEDRRAYEWECLDHYHNMLTTKLNRVPPFTKEYVKQSYKESMCFVAGCAILNHGLLTDALTDEENITIGQRVVALLEDVIDPNHYGFIRNDN